MTRFRLPVVCLSFMAILVVFLSNCRVLSDELEGESRYVSRLPVLPKRVLCDIKQVVDIDMSQDSVNNERPLYLYSPKMPFQYSSPNKKILLEKIELRGLKSVFNGSYILHFEINSSDGSIHFVDQSKNKSKLIGLKNKKPKRPAFEFQEGDEHPVILSGKDGINTDGPYYVGYYSNGIPNYTSFLFLSIPSMDGVRVFQYYDQLTMFFGFCH